VRAGRGAWVGGGGALCAAATIETKERIETSEISLKSLFIVYGLHYLVLRIISAGGGGERQSMPRL
jgi:hypothetical protein